MMKKKYSFVLLMILLFTRFSNAQEQQKNYINYQGVARNAANELMVDQSMTLGVSIRFGSANAAVSYEETHMLTTDANGVFSLKIGNGNAVSGDYDNLPWGSGAAFVTIFINGSEVGTTELMAVPYAITSGDADDQTAAEVAYDNSVSNLSATTAQAAIDELAGSGMVDADPDPTNELQNLSFDTNTNELSLSDGNTVTIPSGGTDADADPTNELQDISLSGTELSISDGSTINLAPIIPPGGTDDQNLELNGDVLSIENGNGSVDLSTYRNDNDADPTNEYQTLSFDGSTNELSLSNGNTVTLPNGGNSGTDDQNLELNGDVLSIENGNGSVDLANYRDDNDSDPTNEIDVTAQNGLLMGDGAQVTGLQGTADGQVPKWDDTNGEWIAGTDATSGGNSVWAQTLLFNNIYYNQGRVGIGTASSPKGQLEVFANSNSNNPQLALTENEDEFARLAFQNSVHDAVWHVAGYARNLGNGAANSYLNFFFRNSQVAENIMTVKGHGRVGIRNSEPQATLDVNGSMNINGDFVNQAVYRVYPITGTEWIPPASSSGQYIDFPGAVLNIDVPVGSKVYIGFTPGGNIDSDRIDLSLYRDGNRIAAITQACYGIAGSREIWAFNMNHLDIDVTPGLHTYKIQVYQSDDAEDNIWFGDYTPNRTSFYALVIKE